MEKNEKKKYNYKGAFEPVNVRVVTFYNMPDFIFSFQQWEEHGGWRGLIKMGAFNLVDVKKVVTGTMHPIEFDKLEAWEG